MNDKSSNQNATAPVVSNTTSMSLMDFRRHIDEIDDEIVRLFKDRMNVSREIACYKKEHGLSTLDATREQDKLASIDEKAGVELRTYAHALYSTILKLSREYQDVTLHSPSLRV